MMHTGRNKIMTIRGKGGIMKSINLKIIILIICICALIVITLPASAIDCKKVGIVPMDDNVIIDTESVDGESEERTIVYTNPSRFASEWEFKKHFEAWCEVLSTNVEKRGGHLSRVTGIVYLNGENFMGIWSSEKGFTYIYNP